jgi:hypothetical protein
MKFWYLDSGKWFDVGDNFKAEDVLNKLRALQNGEIKVESTKALNDSDLILAAMITPVLNVSPKCLNDSTSYIEALNSAATWALMSK